MATYTGKTVTEAIDNGLSDLQVNRHQSNIKVVKFPKMGMFGRVRQAAVVEIEPLSVDTDLGDTLPAETPMTADENRLLLLSSISQATAEYVKYLATEKKITLNYEIKVVPDQFFIEMSSNDEEELIGPKGQTINQFQELANQYVVNAEKNPAVQEANIQGIKVELDINGYRAKRSRILRKVATRAEKVVGESEGAIYFDPMPKSERDQIHAFLQDSETVRSFPEGQGDERTVVVAPLTKLND